MYIVLGALALALALYCLICMLRGGQFEESLKRVPDGDFSLKRFLPIGLVTQRLLFKIGGRRCLIGGEEVRRKLSMLYGENQVKFFSLIYSAHALACLIVLLLIGLLFTAASEDVELLVLFGIVIVAVVAVAQPRRLDSLLEERQQAIRMEFPDFLSKFILLLGAGMTVPEAWDMAGRAEDMNTPFYREVAQTNHEMNELGAAPAVALRSFALRMRDSDISRFVSSVVQYIEYSGDLAEALTQQSSEAWRNRKQEALRLGETASTKLSGTMVLMFLAIMLLVMAPAMMTMEIGF